ncbi:MAG: hypothetical protein JW956_15115 [Calditrichaceae bacterium]|nr:hypothetical protein [Calditrichaceae bacterium]
MNRKIVLSLILFTILILSFSCAEKKETVSVGTHPEGWGEVGNENFHGTTVLENAGRLNSCNGCHGSDFEGEGNVEMSCYRSGCHVLYPHKSGFNDEVSTAFHGKFIADSLDWDKDECQSCHGEDYLGNGYDFKNCLTCHSLYPHADGFESAASANFHGSYIASESFDISGCTDCHGTNYQGNGYIIKNCYNCHSLYPHKTGFASTSSANFHGTFIADSLSGNVARCTVCHGTDYQGNGYEEKNCQSCHALYPHAADFAKKASDNFHGDYIAETLDFDLEKCQDCHGTDFKGDGNDNKNCYRCHALYPHALGFDNEESENFHGEYIEETLDYELSSCVDCHGADFEGAGYEQKNCRACHEEYPHAEGVTDTLSIDFHGKDLAENYGWDASSCESCHGENYDGEGVAEKNCRTCHEIYPHIAGFSNPGLPTYHGQYIINTLSFDITSCAACHGNNYSGNGYAEKDCRACHEDYPHPQAFTNTESDDFHGKYLAEEHNWIMDECQKCHGNNYSGAGYSQKNCKSCHPGPDGPEACNTCHGGNQNAGPPPDLAGNTETTFLGVGAHQAHLQTSDISNTNAMGCTACHITPSDYKNAGHLDDTEFAEVVFNEFVTDSGRVDAQWNHNSATCSNIYCHGAFEFIRDSSGNQFAYADSLIVGNNPDLSWTDVGTGQADCGTCHSNPPIGHQNFPNCYSCHDLVVDSEGNIIDKSRHINGKINYNED